MRLKALMGRGVLALGISALVGPAPSPGQTPAPVPAAFSVPLTLAEALALAARNNERSGIARARVDRARALRREAYATLWPDVNVTGTFTRRSQEVTRTIDGDEVVVQALNAISGVATVDATLVDVRAFPVARSASRNLEAQENASAEIRRTLAYEVAETFFSVLSAERLRDAASQRIEVAQATVSDARIRLEAGLASSNDHTRAELELATARLSLTQAVSLVRTARLSLGYLIGAPAERPLVEPGAEPTEGEGLDALERVALDSRADLKELTLRAEALRLLALEPKLRFVPTMSLRGTYRGTNEAGLSGRETDWNLAALFSWEVFDGGVRYAQAAAREAEYREALLTADALKRQIGLEVRTACTDLETARAALEQAEVRARVAEQNAREVRVRYSEGLATALEQADATASAFEAAAELARQRFALGVARLSLSQALGRWPADAPPSSETHSTVTEPLAP
jgi:outer membrane protein TolC